MAVNDKSVKNTEPSNGLVVKWSPGKEHDDPKLFGLILVCLALNIVCNLICNITGIPFYFDCIGTIVAAMIGGFMPSVLVGFLTNVITTVLYKWLYGSDSSNLYYCIVSVFIALTATVFAQKGYFKKLHIKMVVPLACFIILGGGLRSIIT